MTFLLRETSVVLPRDALSACRIIAHELVTVIKGNVSVDWMHRDSARANIRRHVKRLLRKYGYPLIELNWYPVVELTK